MKTIRLLATLLLVALCTGFYSCEGDDFEIAPSDTMTPAPGLPPSSDELFSEYIKNSSNITCKYYYEKKDSMSLSGIKDKHLWFACFNKITKEQISEWTDIEKTDTIQKIYKGYGEYETLHIRTVLPIYYKTTSSGNIVTFYLGNKKQTIFTSNNTSKRTPLQHDHTKNAAPNDWYSESVFIDNCCYSHEGDTIYIAKKKPDFNNGKLIDTELISHEEGIEIKGSSFRKYDFEKAEYIWRNSIDTYLGVPSDSKFSYTRLDNSTNIWRYKADVTFYDGTNKDFAFYLNINNGNIADNINSLPLCGRWRYYNMNSKSDRNISFNFGGKGSWKIFYTNNETSISKQFTYTFDGENKLIIDLEGDKTETYSILITDKHLRITKKDGLYEFYNRV